MGVANVNRPQLERALELAPISAVQVALSPYDDSALRGGAVERCAEAGVAVIAHSPLGGPRRARRLTRDRALAEVAASTGATPAEVALAWVLGLSPGIVAIPGARRPESATSAARAASLDLGDEGRATLARAFGQSRPARRARSRTTIDADVVLVVGIPGAGKSRVAAEYVDQGYLRLNRDERGGTLRELADALDEHLSAGDRRVVLDNTYLTRASRSHVVDVAGRHRVPVRCVWLDTPLAQAQVNLVERLLERFGRLPSPEELRALSRAEPGLIAPTSQMRALRELEPPADDEGFAGVERVPFARAAGFRTSQRGCLRRGRRDEGAELARRGGTRPTLLRPISSSTGCPGGAADALAESAERLGAAVSGPVESALCAHPGGPPTCWCRPPLPGLPLAFARAHEVDPARSTLIGTSTAHRTLATTLGARSVSF